MNIPENLAEIVISYSCGIKPTHKINIKCSRDAENILRKVFPSFEHREYFYILCLNRSNMLLGYYQVSSGGISGTISDVRLIYQTAIKSNSSAIILAHNHPSGNLNASDADKNLTKKVKEAGELLDITVLDHIILSADGYQSMADENQL